MKKIKTRKAMYIKRKIEASSLIHFCRGKVISIANSERLANISYPASKSHETYYIFFFMFMVPCILKILY